MVDKLCAWVVYTLNHLDLAISLSAHKEVTNLSVEGNNTNC